MGLPGTYTGAHAQCNQIMGLPGTYTGAHNVIRSRGCRVPILELVYQDIHARYQHTGEPWWQHETNTSENSILQ